MLTLEQVVELKKVCPEFAEVLSEIVELFLKKNHDYAKGYNPFSNFEEAARFAGLKPQDALRVLQGVKIARIMNLRSKQAAPANEPELDSVLDLAVYLLLELAHNRVKPYTASMDHKLTVEAAVGAAARAAIGEEMYRMCPGGCDAYPSSARTDRWECGTIQEDDLVIQSQMCKTRVSDIERNNVQMPGH
jgi:hypothetical protein